MFIINILPMPGASTELAHLFIKELINLILGLIVGGKKVIIIISIRAFFPQGLPHLACGWAQRRCPVDSVGLVGFSSVNMTGRIRLLKWVLVIFLVDVLLGNMHYQHLSSSPLGTKRIPVTTKRNQSERIAYHSNPPILLAIPRHVVFTSGEDIIKKGS